jgi:hypothetical protein
VGMSQYMGVSGRSELTIGQSTGVVLM